MAGGQIPHFLVYANMSEGDMKARVARLEKFDAALRGLFKVPGEDSTTIYVTRSTDEIRKLIGQQDVAGFYKGDAQGAVGFIPEALDNDITGITAEQVMFHEYTHHILLSNESAAYPGWMSEGLAELFSTMKFQNDGSVVIGLPVDNRGYAMMGRNRWSARRLLLSDANPPSDDERIELYSRGWLLCHYLLLSGNRKGQIFAYIAAINKGRPPLEAAQSVFGDLDKLDSELETYLHRSKLPGAVLSADQVKASTQVSLRKLSEGEAAIMPYRMASANGVNSTTAGPLAQKAHAAADRFTSDVFVQRSLAEMDYDAGAYDLADTEAGRALAVDPGDVMAMIYRGRVAAVRALRGSGPDAEAHWKEARSWFLKANKADPNHALPFVLYYDSFMATGEPVPEGAKIGLQRAAVLAPADMSLRMQVALMFIGEGDLALARSLLVPMTTDAHSSGRNPYIKLVQAIDSGADKAALIAKVKELKLDGMNEFTPLREKGKGG
jgi:tetratricopeptide (TPR) repeat protein